VVIDPDAEVQAAIWDVFTSFAACGSADGVVAAFAGQRFPLLNCEVANSKPDDGVLFIRPTVSCPSVITASAYVAPPTQGGNSAPSPAADRK
jgi:hypothetical protein